MLSCGSSDMSSGHLASSGDEIQAVTCVFVHSYIHNGVAGLIFLADDRLTRSKRQKMMDLEINREIAGTYIIASLCFKQGLQSS